MAAAAATLAAIFWINTPFTHELITGYAFGVSDIVLAFTVALSFVALSWYLKEEQTVRKNYPWWKITIISLIVALPIMTKNLLGAIPAATFFVLLLRDFKLSKKFWVGGGSFIVLLIAYYLPLFISSPETFKAEVLVSFLHGTNYEGWGRPSHWYVTNYLPQRYLLKETLVFWIWLAFAVTLFFKGKLDRLNKILLGLPLLWFVWNLVVVSLVESKIPNFIYQSYLLVLFAIVFAAFLGTERLMQYWPGLDFEELASKKIIAGILSVTILLAGYEMVQFGRQFQLHRAQAYSYNSEHEKFYEVGEWMQREKWDSKDLVVVRVSDSDCWFRYYPLFLTGAESKTLLEMYFGFDAATIKEKYSRMHFVMKPDDKFAFTIGDRQTVGDYVVVSFNLTNLSTDEISNQLNRFIQAHTQDIQVDILRIKKDLTSCQWLVPGYILNAP